MDFFPHRNCRIAVTTPTSTRAQLRGWSASGRKQPLRLGLRQFRSGRQLASCSGLQSVPSGEDRNREIVQVLAIIPAVHDVRGQWRKSVNAVFASSDWIVYLSVRRPAKQRGPASLRWVVSEGTERQRRARTRLCWFRHQADPERFRKCPSPSTGRQTRPSTGSRSLPVAV